MDFRGMESASGSRRFQAAARKLLAGKAEPTPATLAPSPGITSAYMCHDIKTGAAVSCQNPHTLVIIVAGMACMMFLVTIALLLLFWSVVRQRRIERLRRESGGADQTTSSPSGTPAAAPAVAPVDSPEFDNAVLVQLPGDEKPQFFALPKPFPADDHPQQDAKALPAVAIKSEEKEPSSQNPSFEDGPPNPVTEDACVPSSDGLFHNPLFAPR